MIEVNDLVRFSNTALRVIVARAGKHHLLRGKQRISRVVRIVCNYYRDSYWERVVEIDCPDVLHPENFMRISVRWLVLYKKAKKVPLDFPAEEFARARVQYNRFIGTVNPTHVINYEGVYPAHVINESQMNCEQLAQVSWEQLAQRAREYINLR